MGLGIGLEDASGRPAKRAHFSLCAATGSTVCSTRPACDRVASHPTSRAFEHRLAPLDERARALAHVGAGKTQSEGLLFEQQRLIQRAFAALDHTGHDVAQRDRRRPGQLLRDAFDLGIKLLGFDHTCQQAQRLRACGIDGRAQQAQLQRRARTGVAAVAYHRSPGPARD